MTVNIEGKEILILGNKVFCYVVGCEEKATYSKLKLPNEGLISRMEYFCHYHKPIGAKKYAKKEVPKKES